MSVFGLFCYFPGKLQEEMAKEAFAKEWCKWLESYSESDVKSWLRRMYFWKFCATDVLAGLAIEVATPQPTATVKIEVDIIYCTNWR